MKRTLITLAFTAVFIAPVLADKPEWAGKGSPNMGQRSNHESAMQAKGGYDDRGEKMKKQTSESMGDVKDAEKKQLKKEEKLQKKQKDGERFMEQEQSGELKGMEKQQAKKAEQLQKELGKGSEQGQAKREENRKKWWKFWGE